MCFDKPSRIHSADTMTFLQLESRCPLSMTSLTNISGIEAPEVFDADPSTCVQLDENARNWTQIIFPNIMIKGQFYVSLMGNLKCSPTFGLGVSVINDCKSGTCSYSRCIVSDLTTSDGIGGCKYRCHSYSVCNHITVDIAGVSGIGFSGILCDIVF